MNFLKEVAIEVRNILLVLIAPTFVALSIMGCGPSVPKQEPEPFQVNVLKVIPQNSGVMVTVESVNPVRRFAVPISGSPSSGKDVVIPAEGEKWMVAKGNSGGYYNFVKQVK